MLDALPSGVVRGELSRDNIERASSLKQARPAEAFFHSARGRHSAAGSWGTAWDAAKTAKNIKYINAALRSELN
jgi:hypothetical protein